MAVPKSAVASSTGGKVGTDTTPAAIGRSLKDNSIPVSAPVAPLSKRITNGPAKSKRSNNGQPKTRPFVAKLWSMVNDEGNSEYIHWMPDGKSFQVVGRELFEKTVLPKYFKHSNFSSFVRQLNMYGWHKVQDVTSGAMQTNEEKWQFQSPNFIRDREDLLDNIVRNRGSKGSDDEEEVDLNRIFEELNVIKENQVSISQDLYRIRKDNELLWTENYQNQERHKKHAETLDRILRFLASIYGNQGKLLADIMSPIKQGQRLLMPSGGMNLSSSIEPITEIDASSAGSGAKTSDTPGSVLSHDRLMSISSNSADPITEIIGSPDSVAGNNNNSNNNNTNSGSQVPTPQSHTAATSTPNTTSNLAPLDPNSLALTPYDNLLTGTNPALPPSTLGTTGNNPSNITSSSNTQTPGVFQAPLPPPPPRPVFPELTMYNDPNSLNANIVSLDDDDANAAHASAFAPEPALSDDQLIKSTRDIEEIARHIESQGDSIQNLQELLHRINPNYVKEESLTPEDLAPVTDKFADQTTPGLDPNFDEFLVDASGTPNFDMTNPVDGDFHIGSPIPFDVAPSPAPPNGPSKKRRKVSGKSVS
ncbi:stress-responsive transcription factor HSF1 [Sugiyamaella lignohabitans]|uniref:Heat shock transcription factor n=1 Tax=Sugiyamaella lignohabitans TaxID=796027 RepID=A0A167EJ47_9ASCO|nr:stress-responsive transcription factor HSF1 [Sugiyamaella lignohabitans]ANB14141.1 stress-responsive transcription factor HSF1 [Sugiyamaella lignohabitans]